MILFRHRGNFHHTEDFFDRMLRLDLHRKLEKYGKDGVEALVVATPSESGKTANSWDYEIVSKPGLTSIRWTNSNVRDGVNIAVILDYGHGTRNGGYVAARNYIDPALEPVFKRIADDAWKEVKSS